MPWAGQTWLEMFQESSYGVFSGAGATAFPRSYGGNSFTMRPVPARQVIRTADAGNRRIQVVANFTAFAGTLKTLLYPTQAAYWMTAATTLTSNDLHSYSIQYWDSIRPQRYLGAKVKAMRIGSVANTDYLTLELDWIAQSLDASFVSFTQPAQSSYPPELPYCHTNSKGNILLGGSAYTLYKDFNVTVNNVLQGTRDEATTISALYYCGRDFDFTTTQEYTDTTHRVAYEAQTPLTWVIGWNIPTPHSVTFTCEASGYISAIADDLPLDNAAYAALTNEIYFDKAAATDFTVTVV